jgi:hypothetical protein
VLPIIEQSLDAGLDAHAAKRFDEMQEKYADYIARVRARASDG